MNNIKVEQKQIYQTIEVTRELKYMEREDDAEKVDTQKFQVLSS